MPDPSDPQVLNRYAYAKNNPLRYNDPSGHEVGDVGGGEFPFFCLWCSPVITPTPDSPAYQYQPAYQQPQVQDMVTQTAEMAMGRNAPKLYGAEFGAAYQDLFGSKDFSSTSLLDFIQAGLSVGGFVPGLNTRTSVLDAGISLFRGDYSGAGLAAVGAIPVLGTLRKFGEGIPEGIRAIEAVRELFAPGGKLIGEAGRSEGVQILSGGKNAIETLFLDAAQHGRLIDKPFYNGLFVDLGQGSFVAYRDSLRHGPTIDFKLPGISEANKFHVK